MSTLILFLFVFLVGYGLGRRVGKKEGQTLGVAQAAIDLRILALTNGHCPICQFSYEQDGL